MGLCTTQDDAVARGSSSRKLPVLGQIGKSRERDFLNVALLHHSTEVRNITASVCTCCTLTSSDENGYRDRHKFKRDKFKSGQLHDICISKIRALTDSSSKNSNFTYSNTFFNKFNIGETEPPRSCVPVEVSPLLWWHFPWG